MSDELSVLVVEDNPGDARLIEEMLAESEELTRRADLDATDGSTLSVHNEQHLGDALDYLADNDVAVVLLDLNLPDSAGLDTLATVVDETEWVPIVVLTGIRDEQLGIEAVKRGAQDYLVKDEVTSDLLVRSIHHAIEREDQERERARRREQLEALNRLNRISQDVTHAVITSSTREELERAVCERLAESDAYRFAWIGKVDPGTDRVVPRVAAGVEEGYLDDITITVDDGDTGQGPAGMAVRTNEVQVMQNMRTDPAFEPWREEALERGYRSSASIPIVYEGLLYGVLNVYATSPDAFSEPEMEILERLGDAVGHAIAAIERKDALVSESVLELEFELGGFAEPLVTRSATESCTMRFDDVVQGDDALLAYGRVEGLPRESFREAAEQTDVVDDVRILSRGEEAYEVELVSEAASALSESLAAHGASIRSAAIDDGQFRFTVEMPQGRDTRPLIELVEEHCPEVTLKAQRTDQPRDDTFLEGNGAYRDRLTEKQRTALETAYLAGHFEWPRESTGEEIADRLGVSAPTFHQHLRTAEKKLLDLLFEDEDDTAS